jgi:hypothetical protein
MEKRVLYIGNNLTINSFTATYISFFSKVLKKEGYDVRTASNKSNKALQAREKVTGFDWETVKVKWNELLE